MFDKFGQFFTTNLQKEECFFHSQTEYVHFASHFGANLWYYYLNCLINVKQNRINTLVRFLCVGVPQRNSAAQNQEKSEKRLERCDFEIILSNWTAIIFTQDNSFIFL